MPLLQFLWLCKWAVIFSRTEATCWHLFCFQAISSDTIFAAGLASYIWKCQEVLVPHCLAFYSKEKGERAGGNAACLTRSAHYWAVCIPRTVPKEKWAPAQSLGGHCDTDLSSQPRAVPIPAALCSVFHCSISVQLVSSWWILTNV